MGISWNYPKRWHYYPIKTTVWPMKPCKGYKRQAKQGPEVVVFVPHFYELLDSKRSYVRTRGIILLAANAKWISEKELERILPKLLEHIADPKPITARQCIQCLPQIVDEKPVTAPAIVAALKQVKLTGYQESMQKLVAQDIQQVLRQIQKN